MGAGGGGEGAGGDGAGGEPGAGVSTATGISILLRSSPSSASNAISFPTVTPVDPFCICSRKKARSSPISKSAFYFDSPPIRAERVGEVTGRVRVDD